MGHQSVQRNSNAAQEDSEREGERDAEQEKEKE